jgi:osmoprotectant transport system permease protein
MSTSRKSPSPPVASAPRAPLASRVASFAVPLLLVAFVAWRLATGWDGVVSWWDFLSTRWDDVLSTTIEHVILTVTAVFAATVLALVVGVAVHDRSGPRNVALTVASVLLTIPSLALFAIFIPLLGLGFKPSVLALFLYALLPVLRNTITGLQGVDPAILESAKGMGMGRVERVRKIQLPLAWPVIMTGVRLATTLVISIAAIATLVAGGGLGDFIKDGLARFPLPTSVERIWTGTVFVVILALVLDALLGLIQRLTTSKGLRS